MSNTVKIDGKEFSEETVKEALKKHCNFESDVEPKEFRINYFVAVDTKDGTGCPYLLGSLRLETTIWDKDDTMDSKDGQINWYERHEIEQIIAGLQGLLDS